MFGIISAEIILCVQIITVSLWYFILFAKIRLTSLVIVIAIRKLLLIIIGLYVGVLRQGLIAIVVNIW